MRVKIIQKTVLTFCLLALVGFSAPMLVHGAEDRQIPISISIRRDA